MAITFQVSRVERAFAPLNNPTAQGAAAHLHGAPVEALGASTPGFIPANHHGLLSAVGQAFALHYPLVLSPDTIWLAIAQGFAQHITANAERLRSKFVRHEGQPIIEIRRDDFIKGSSQNPWPEVFSAFSDAIAEHIGRQRDLVVCDFSTTGQSERAASEIVLLDAMKSYFRYEVLTRCGIPEITLEGTVDDWRSIRRRARALEEYDLAWWTEGLGPVLDELVATAEGRVDVRFWELLFKDIKDSGGPYIQGWINALFPYLRAGREKDGELRRNEMVTAWAKGPDASFGGGTPRRQIPSGLSSVPFVWDYFEVRYPMEFLGGFVGVAQDPGTLALRPAIGWAVRDAAPGTPPP